MKKTVFKGEIDGKTFDNLKEFQEYLNEHKDAAAISFRSSVEDVKEETIEDKCGKYELYPHEITPDDFVSKYDEDYDTGLDKIGDYLYNQGKQHAAALPELNDELLDEHQKNLENLRDNIDKQHEEAQKAIEQLDKKRNIVYAGSDLLELYLDHYDELLSEVDAERERRSKKVSCKCKVEQKVTKPIPKTAPVKTTVKEKEHQQESKAFINDAFSELPEKIEKLFSDLLIF